MLAFDTTREARLTRNESKAAEMEQKFYDFEVERTMNLGNMTMALLMLASSMDTLTRFVFATTASSFKLPMQSPSYLRVFRVWLACCVRTM